MTYRLAEGVMAAFVVVEMAGTVALGAKEVGSIEAAGSRELGVSWECNQSHSHHRHIC